MEKRTNEALAPKVYSLPTRVQFQANQAAGILQALACDANPIDAARSVMAAYTEAFDTWPALALYEQIENEDLLDTRATMAAIAVELADCVAEHLAALAVKKGRESS